MEGKIYRIALDLKKNLVTNVETLVQNDVNSNTFEIEVYDNGTKKNYNKNYKLEIAAKKADQTVVVDTIENIGDYAIWNLSEQVLTCAGYVVAELRILNAEDVLTASQSFKFLVRPNNLNDETIKSTSQYKALDEAIKKAESLQKDLQGVPEQVASIKAQFDTVKAELESSQKELLAGLELSNKNISEIKTYISTINEQIEELKEKEDDISNLKSLLKNLEDLKTRLANLEATLSDAKTTDSSLKSNITKGNKTNSNLQGSITTATSTQNSLRDKTAAGIDINNKLGQSIKTGQGIVTNINTADKGLADKITTVDTCKANLDKSISTSNTAKTNLDKSKAQAESTKIALDMANSEASSNKAALDSSINKAETTKTNLDASTTQANDTKSALDKSIETGQAVNKTSETNKLNLDKSIQDAKDAKANLDESTGKANTTKSNVDASTATADAKNAELISTTSTATSADEAAKQTITELQALLNKSASTEQSLKEIIASGNLDKYVTDPKLREALTDYVTTGNLSTELANYVKSVDLVSMLDGKVDKVTGKTLTSNDFTDSYKSKLDSLTKITKVSQLANDSNYVTDLKLQEALAKIKTLKKEVVQTLPATGQDDVIYLVKDSKGKANNVYLEYLWINNAFELIGSTQVDLTGYAKTADVDQKLANKVDTTKHQSDYNTLNSNVESKYNTLKSQIDGKVDKVSGKQLSSNDYTNAEKSKLSSINTSDYARQNDISNAKAKSNKSNINVFTDRSISYTSLDVILGDLELRTEQNRDNKADKSDIKTKLSELTDDSAHRTVADAEKSAWNNKANVSDIKTKLSEMTGDSTHRLVTDAEKSTWNSKLSSVSGQDISRAKTKGYNTSSTWQSLSTNRDLEDWIGDFDKRTRENRSNLSSKANKSDIVDFKRCIVITRANYKNLSITEKNREDTLYLFED